MFVWVVAVEMCNRIRSYRFSVNLSFNAYVSSVDKDIQNFCGGLFFLCGLNIKLLCTELACCRVWL